MNLQQKHLLKTISRKKHVHVHVNQAPQVQSSSVAACVEVGKFGLEEEVGRLKQDKNVLMQELVRLRQQQEATDHWLQTVGQHVQVMEQRQQQMMSFLAEAVDGSLFLPVESGFHVDHVSTAISEVQSPFLFVVTDHVKTNYSTEKNMYNTGPVTTVLNSSEIKGMLPESSVAISNTNTVAYEPMNVGYMDSTSPVLDVTVSKETGVFSSDQNVDILVDAIPRLPSINDAFWEQFLAASPLTGDTDEIHPSSQESSIAKESEVISWEENGWNKVQQMNHLTEQMCFLTSEGKRG